MERSTAQQTIRALIAWLLWLTAVAELIALAALAIWWLLLKLSLSNQLRVLVGALAIGLMAIAALVLAWCGLRMAIRSRFQFRLRTLLVVVAVANIGFAILLRPLLHTYQHNHRRQAAERARQVVGRLGGTIAYDNDEEFELALHAPDFLEDNVQFYGKSLSDADLKALAGHPNLRWIVLRDCQVSEAAIHQLTEAVKLKHLDITGATLSDDAVQRIKAALPNCQVQR